MTNKRRQPRAYTLYARKHVKCPWCGASIASHSGSVFRQHFKRWTEAQKKKAKKTKRRT